MHAALRREPDAAHVAVDNDLPGLRAEADPLRKEVAPLLPPVHRPHTALRTRAQRAHQACGGVGVEHLAASRRGELVLERPPRVSLRCGAPGRRETGQPRDEADHRRHSRGPQHRAHALVTRIENLGGAHARPAPRVVALRHFVSIGGSRTHRKDLIRGQAPFSPPNTRLFVLTSTSATLAASAMATTDASVAHASTRTPRAPLVCPRQIHSAFVVSVRAR